MKKAFVGFVLILCSCNNGTDDQPTVVPAQPANQEMILRESIKKYPDSLLLVENLIQYFRDSGNYSNAIAEVDKALKSDSSNARLWDIKATLHFEDADTTNAISAFEKAIALVPDQQRVISLGTLYAETKNQRALPIADGLLANTQSKAAKEAYFIKGLYFSAIKQSAKAIEFFDKALAVSFTFMDAYREKSIVLYDQGKYEEALAVLDKALTLQNNFDEGYYYSGKCLEKLNRIPEAIQSYKNALAYDPDYVEAKEALARLNGK